MNLWPILLTLAAAPISPDTVTVARVIDGDTIVLTDSTRVRLIGVDAAETNRGSESARARGRVATAWLDSVLTGKVVILEYDSHGLTDRFGRRLAYVRMDSLDVNRKLIRLGLAKLFIKYKFDRMTEFQSGK